MHRMEAIANRRIAELLLSTQPQDAMALRWGVTMTFYSALYALAAHLIAHGLTVTRHDDRSLALADPRNGVPQNVFDAYQFLKRRSTGARYHVQTFAPYQVQRLLDVPLTIVFNVVGL
jgi:hypothetical protein